MPQYWPPSVSDKQKATYEKMNGCGKFFKLMLISDKELYVLAGDIDTYIYLLFLRMAVYFMFALCIVNNGVLLPIYSNGSTGDYYAQSCLNGTKALTDIQ